MDLGLAHKVAMVGGASKGLGFAVARALAAEGAHVVIAGRDEDAIERAAATINAAAGGRALGVAADLSKADAITRWMAAASDRFGGVDLLFANTGGPPAGTALSFDDMGWQNAFELLLLSVIRTVRLVVPSMRERGGGAILVGTSSTVKEPFPNLALSNVMRSGVTSLVKTLSIELAPERIRVNSLLPGRISTDRLAELDEIHAKTAGVTLAEQQRRGGSSIPIGRYGAPDEFGRAGAFLLSDAASYITGAALQVDGGLIKGLL
jgi:3-oxoacyl-[acyl-carrier protein] reductase